MVGVVLAVILTAVVLIGALGPIVLFIMAVILVMKGMFL
jgi:hypothetical protein